MRRRARGDEESAWLEEEVVRGEERGGRADHEHGESERADVA